MNKLKEEDLLPVITTNLTKKGFKLQHTHELDSGFGVADIVYYSLDRKVLKERLDNNIPPIDSYDLIKILTQLNTLDSRSVGLTFINKIVSTTSIRQEKIITFLIDRGFLVPEARENTYLIGKNYKIGLQEVIAVEAKISNWKRGLYQAYRYKAYANKSYLALYSKYIHRATKSIEEFVRFNVGLIEVKDNAINILFDPKVESSKKNIYSALVYENILKRNKHFFPSH